jgi:hypothetical protein
MGLVARVRGHDLGHVVDALPGGPVTGARVRVAIPGAEAIYAMADDGGQFLVNNLKAGPYALIVQGADIWSRA